MNYKELNGHSIREGFEAFNETNPHVYAAFEEQALKAIRRGRTKLSSKLIINWIRWHEFLKTDDVNFRINDAYQAYFSRMFVKKHPQYSNVFNFRVLRNEKPGPYMEVSAEKVKFT